MSRLRDNDADFEGAVVSAAERLGLAPLFVEKDYWVTRCYAPCTSSTPARSS
jgi:hypothetical protein